MQKNQIAEYRYIAKEMQFHNILPLQTILPLHNFTNYAKIFLLKVNMIYTNHSEAAGIRRKLYAFTVWKKKTVFMDTNRNEDNSAWEKIKKF